MAVTLGGIMEKRTLTKEIKEQLLGIAPFSKDSVIEYVPEQFKGKKLPKEFIPVFTVHGLTKTEQDDVNKKLKDLEDVGEVELREIARKKTIGWKNLFDVGSEMEIPFEADEQGLPKEELWERIPSSIIGDILFYIVKISGLINIDKLSLK